MADTPEEIAIEEEPFFEVPKEIVEEWNKVAADHMISLTLPKGAIGSLMHVLRQSLVMQADVVKLALAVGSKNSDAVDQIIKHWSADLKAASSSLNRFAGQIMLDELIKIKEGAAADEEKSDGR